MKDAILNGTYGFVFMDDFRLFISWGSWFCFSLTYWLWASGIFRAFFPKKHRDTTKKMTVIRKSRSLYGIF
jgi:hypothetical protein